MVSKDKKILLDDLAAHAERIAEQAEEIKRLRKEVAAHELRDRDRMRREHRRLQEERRQAEQKAHRERINDLAVGKLDISRATDWGIIHEEGRTGIQVFVPLDSEEQRVALGYLRRTGDVLYTQDLVNESWARLRKVCNI